MRLSGLRATFRLGGAALWLAPLMAIAGCGIGINEGNIPPAAPGLDKTPTVAPGVSSAALSLSGGMPESGPARPNSLPVSYSALRMVESERKELLRRVERLAEAQRAELERELDSELEARRKELLAANELEYAEGKKQTTSDCVEEIRAVEVSQMERRANLRVKIAAARTRLGLFGPAADEETNKRIALLNSELDQLDKDRAERVKSARDKEARNILELDNRRQDKQEADAAKLRENLAGRLQTEMSAVRARLSADLVAGVFDGGDVSRKPADASKQSSGDQLDAAHLRARAAAELQFQRSFRAAMASQQERKIKMGRRQREDGALTGGNSSRRNG